MQLTSRIGWRAVNAALRNLPLPPKKRRKAISSPEIEQVIQDIADEFAKSDPFMMGHGDGNGPPWVPERFIGPPSEGKDMSESASGKSRYDYWRMEHPNAPVWEALSADECKRWQSALPPLQGGYVEPTYQERLKAAMKEMEAGYAPLRNKPDGGGFAGCGGGPGVWSGVSPGQLQTQIEESKRGGYAPLRNKPDGGGLRYNDGKARYDLIPPEALEALAMHFTKGAEKYADRNWERGMDWCKCFASMMRHAWSWMRGEDADAETQSHHMIAVAWNALALYTYAVREIGRDDRPALGHESP